MMAKPLIIFMCKMQIVQVASSGFRISVQLAHLFRQAHLTSSLTSEATRLLDSTVWKSNDKIFSALPVKMRFYEQWTPKIPGLKIKTEDAPAAPNVDIRTDASYSRTFNPDVTYPTGDTELWKMKSPEEITEYLASLLPEVKDEKLSEGEVEVDPDALLKELHERFLKEWYEDEDAVSDLMEKAGEMERENEDVWERLKTDAYYDKVKRSEKKTKHGIQEVEALELMWALEQIENEKSRREQRAKREGGLIGATKAELTDDDEIPEEE